MRNSLCVLLIITTMLPCVWRWRPPPCSRPHHHATHTHTHAHTHAQYGQPTLIRSEAPMQHGNALGIVACVLVSIAAFDFTHVSAPSMTGMHGVVLFSVLLLGGRGLP